MTVNSEKLAPHPAERKLLLPRRIFLQQAELASFGATVLLSMRVIGQKHDAHAQTPPSPTGHGTHSALQNMEDLSSRLMPLDAMPSGNPFQAMVGLRKEASAQGIFKATLEDKAVDVQLAGGKTTTLRTYNGLVPGPQIVLNEGDAVEILFKNHLSQPTTIHWHGLPVPPDQDGNPHDPVQPGQERMYRFTLSVGTGGTYWHHPHTHGLVAEQVFRGMAGTLVVRSKNDPLAHLPEQHWLISELRLDKDGSIPENSLLDWLNGREGQFVLINGQHRPSMRVAQNQRLRIWNACSARHLKLEIPGCEWVLMCTEGGLLENPLAPQKTLLLAPAKRVEVLLHTKRGGTFPLHSCYYDRNKMMVKELPVDLLLGKVGIKAGDVKLPKRLNSIAALPTATRKRKRKRTIRLSEDAAQMPALMAGTLSTQEQRAVLEKLFLLGGKNFDMGRFDFTTRVGEVEDWLLVNDSHMDHPFRVHGTQFQIIEQNFNGQTAPAPYHAWKDMVNLRPFEQVLIRTQQMHKEFRM